jgi:sulfur carrier protein ThiS
MKLTVEFAGFPTIYDIFPVGQHAHVASATTIPALVNELIARHGQRVAEALLDPGTKSLDPTIQVAVNGELVRRQEILRVSLTEGDRVTFFRLLAGG